MFKRLLLPVVVLAALAGGWLWWTGRAPEVTVATPVRGSAAEVVYATAVVEPDNWAKVTSVIRERITELCDCEGDQIKKGDVLAVLDSGDANATLTELEARQKLAQAERERAFELLQRRVVSQQIYDRAQSQLIQINALLAAQRERLRDYSILAPMDGVVLRQDGSVGEVVAPGEILFWIGQPTPLQLVAEVNEEDIPKVAKEQIAYIRADAFPDRDLQAIVQRITPKGDPVLKNYRVYLALPEETPLRIGMTVELNIVVREVEDTLLVPVAAFDGSTVQVVDGSQTLTTKTVETGITGTRMVEVLEGLKEGDLVVSPYRDQLAAGQKVRVISAPVP